MTYIEYIIKRLEDAKAGDPIYIGDIAEKMAEHFHMERRAAKAAASVAIKRIIDGRLVNDLKLFRKGIYYKAELNINRLILDKYTRDCSGYEGPLTVLHELGIITRVPESVMIVTNRVKQCTRRDRNLGITVTPPKTPINSENIHYLQILDVIERLDKVSPEVEDPEKILWNHIKRKRMNLMKLLAYADRYYSSSTVLRLVHVLSESGALES